MGKFFEDLHRAIRRSPVDDNMLEVSKGLRRYTLDRLPQKTAMIERRRHNRDRRLRDIAQILTKLGVYHNTRTQGMIAANPWGATILHLTSIRRLITRNMIRKF